jgi:mannose-1-phosphate guanylyltransferase
MPCNKPRRKYSPVFKPADHIMDTIISKIFSTGSFGQRLEHTKIITLGHKPVRPETGYGYNKIKTPSFGRGACFVENPTCHRPAYLADGSYFGMRNILPDDKNFRKHTA